MKASDEKIKRQEQWFGRYAAYGSDLQVEDADCEPRC